MQSNWHAPLVDSRHRGVKKNEELRMGEQSKHLVLHNVFFHLAFFLKY